MQNEVETIFKAILKKINGKTFNDYDREIIKEELSVEIDGVIFHIYVEINDFFTYPDCTVFFDLYDTWGCRMKSDKPNIVKKLENKLAQHYYDERT